MNSFKTTLLLGGLTGLLVALGWAFGGPKWAVIALGVAAVMNVGSYWFSDKIVLASYRAQPIAEDQAPRLHAMMEELAARAEIPKPRLYRIPSAAANAFATGRNPEHAVVAVTDGIVEMLTEEELKGVLAHELGHVRNRDILISSIAATMAGAIMILGRIAWFIPMGGGEGGRDRGNPIGMIVMMVLAPLAAVMIQMAVSRSREYKADATAARWAGPHGLVSALRKLHESARRRPMPAHASSAHLFIAKPALGSMLGGLFSTHPPMEKRIERLMGLAA
jgi:heat shock protein HtpX